MLKQLSLSILLVATGLVSGLALSSRAGDTVERLSPAPVPVGTDGAAAPVVPAGNTADRHHRTGADGQACGACRRHHRTGLHSRRRADRPRRHQHFLHPGGEAAELALRQRPVLPAVLRRRPGRDVRLRQSLRVEPRIRRADFGRRLRGHQQSRRRREQRRGDRCGRRSPRAAGEDHRHRLVDRPRAAEGGGRQPPRHSLGRFVEAEGRGVGDGRRQPVLAEPDGDAGRGQRARPRRRRYLAVPRTSSRPTPRSTRGTPAAR